MKSIGIKLADGSFYPILEEGSPAQKTLDLTTAHDNQTTVMVDLYRSDTDTMEDAEYVDTLQIDNLIAHPNGEPDLSFNISLDENNKLSAAIKDPESGEHSDTTITLVSRTLEERMNQSDFSLSQTGPDGAEEQAEEQDTGTDADAAAALAAGGLLAAAAKKREEKASSDITVPPDEDIVTQTPDFSDLDLPSDLDLTTPPEAADEAAGKEQSALDLTQDYSEPAVEDTSDTYEDTLSFAKSSLGDEPAFEEPQAAEETVQKDQSDTMFDTLPDMTEPSVTLDEPSGSEPVEEMNFDMPDFGTVQDEDKGSAEASAEEDFSLPEFDEVDTQKDGQSDSAADDDFFSTGTTPAGDASRYVNDNTPSNGIKFDGLYDTETVNGSSETKADSETVQRKDSKTKLPVLICLVCALICVIATLLILFVIPSKYNLVTIHNRNESGAQDMQPAAVVQPVQPEQVPVQEQTPAPAPVPEAKEDQVVVAPAAETVVPEKPAAPAKKAEDIVYKIKWGDTLWDIADAYYKNPWRYHRIARYNHIKDPDYIISGTTIKLPAE